MLLIPRPQFFNAIVIVSILSLLIIKYRTVHTNSKYIFTGISILFLLLAAVQKGTAQDVYQEQKIHGFMYGITAGANFATIDNHNFSHYFKVGANMGAAGFVRIGGETDLSIEALYSQKGRNTTQLTGTNVPGLSFIRMYDRLNYAEVPVMINYLDDLNDHFGVGLSYARLLNAVESLIPDGNINLRQGNYPFNKDDIELLAGTEVHLWQQLYLTLRYQYSLLRIREDGPGNFTSPGQHNNLWVLRVVFMFN